MSKTVWFQAIQFSISTQFSSIWTIDRTLSGATNPGQSEPGSDGNEWVLRIPQSSGITGTSASDCLLSYLGHSLVGVVTILQRCSRCILQPQQTGPQETRFLGGVSPCGNVVGVFYSPSRFESSNTQAEKRNWTIS